MFTRSPSPRLMAVVSVVVLIGVWWLIALAAAHSAGAGHTSPIPTPWDVVHTIGHLGLHYYWTQFSVTLWEAGLGYLWGNGIALVLAALVIVVPRLEGVVSQIAVISYCIPVVAIGPVLVLVNHVPAKGEPSGAATFLAGLSVFFTTVVGSLLGLRAADKASLDVVKVYGGNGWTQLRKVRAVAALPAVLTALQIAVPAAFLGAVLGEYFGKIETGVGLAMVISQSTANAPALWSLALLSGLVALVLYLAVGVLTRLSTPWSKGV